MEHELEAGQGMTCSWSWQRELRTLTKNEELSALFSCRLFSSGNETMTVSFLLSLCSLFHTTLTPSSLQNKHGQWLICCQEGRLSLLVLCWCHTASRKDHENPLQLKWHRKEGNITQWNNTVDFIECETWRIFNCSQMDCTFCELMDGCI